MLSDLIACLILYYLFFILQNPTETAIDASQPTEEPLDDWELELAGEVTLLYSTPSLPPTLPPRSSTLETSVHLSPPVDRLYQISNDYQEYIDSLEQNWWHTQYESFRHPFPSKRRKPKPILIRLVNLIPQ